MRIRRGDPFYILYILSYLILYLIFHWCAIIVFLLLKLNQDYFCTPTIHPRPNMKRVLIKARSRKKVAQSREKVRGARKKWRRPDPAMQCNASCVTLAPGFLFVSTIQHHHHRDNSTSSSQRQFNIIITGTKAGHWHAWPRVNLQALIQFRWVHLFFFQRLALCFSAQPRSEDKT